MSKAKPLPPGLLVRETRTYLELSQAELAKRIGVDQSSLSRYERGESDRLSWDRLVVLAKILGLSLADLGIDPVECCPTCGRPLPTSSVT